MDIIKKRVTNPANPLDGSELVYLAQGGADAVALASDLKTYTNTGLPIEIIAAASDETTALTTGTGKVTFRAPCAFTLTSVRASLTTAQTSGSIFMVNVNKNGTTVLSTKITVDNGENTSVTAATPPVISVSSFADDDAISVDIDQIGDGTAKGLKVTLIGTRA